MRKTIALAGAFVLLLALPGSALAKGMSLKQLQGLLSDLGYETTDHGDGRISVDDQGQFKRDINFTLNDDMSVLNIYTALTDIKTDQKDAVPMAALLKANDGNGPFAYAIVTVEGKERLDIEGYFDTALVSKTMLRRTIDHLIAAEDAGEPLWNDDHWAVPQASLAAARAAFETAWEKSPLTIQHGMFVTESPASYGDFVPRPDHVFRAGEALITYLEPEGYTWKPLQDDVTSTALSIDMTISDKDGEVVTDRKDFMSKTITSHGKFMGLYLDVTLTLTGLPAGDYRVRYTLHDMNSTKSAAITLPFTFATDTRS